MVYQCQRLCNKTAKTYNEIFNNNVKNLAEKILKVLNYEQYIIEETKIAAILHDVGAIQGKENHAYRSWEYAKNYFIKNNLTIVASKFSM